MNQNEEIALIGKTAGFTGKRPKELYGWDDPTGGYKRMVDYFIAVVDELYADGYRTFVTGGAQGFDQLMFWSVNRFKLNTGSDEIRNIVCVPFPGQEKKWAEEGIFGQSNYRKMLEIADQVVFVSDTAPSDRGRACAMLNRRNHEIVSHSSLIVGLYPDGGWSLPPTKGGTAACLRYAFDKGVPIRLIRYSIFDSDLAASLSFGSVENA